MSFNFSKECSEIWKFTMKSGRWMLAITVGEYHWPSYPYSNFKRLHWDLLQETRLSGVLRRLKLATYTPLSFLQFLSGLSFWLIERSADEGFAADLAIVLCLKLSTRSARSSLLNLELSSGEGSIALVNRGYGQISFCSQVSHKKGRIFILC